MNELQLLREARPAVPGPDEPGVERARRRLLAAIDAETPIAALAPARRRRRVWMVAPAAAAAALVLVLVLPIVLPGGRGGAPGAAAEALDRLGRVALQQPGTPLGDGQYYYTRSVLVQRSASGELAGSAQETTELVSTPRESWLASDGSARVVQQGLTTDLPPGSDRFADLSSFPSDPQGLRSAIEERRILEGPPGDWSTFDIIGDLLALSYASPEQRRSLFEITGELPGVELVGPRTDAEGRAGIAVSYTYGGVQQILTFDPATSSLLQNESIRVEPASIEPQLQSRTTFLESGVVSALGARP